jgi:hypothetical protein
MKRLELAWATGLFEGEGSIVITERASGYTGRALQLGSTDEDVVRRFAAVVGVGKVSGPHDLPGKRKPLYLWRLSLWADIEPLLQAMLPMLGDRRAAKARQMLSDPPSVHRTRANAPATCPFATMTASGAGYHRHRRDGTPPCRQCLDALAAYQRQQRALPSAT